MRHKSYRYRLYPTKEQEILINKTFGCCRFVYNKALEIKMSLYQQENKGISIFQLTNKIVEWKQQEEMLWLNEVNAQSLQSSLRNLDIAYTRFFKEKKGFPKFKSKRNNHQSFTNSQRTKIDWDNSKIYIPKFKNGIRFVIDRQFEGKIKSSSIIKVPSGKYFISIVVEEEINDIIQTIPEENKSLGIDLGIKHFAVFSSGEKIQNPKYHNKKLKKLKRLQKLHSRKKKGSKNREKSRIKLAKTYEKITNCRKDFLHKLTKRIIDNQNYSTVVIEDLSIQNMLKTKELASHIAHVGWREFRRQLEYKCKWYGKNLIIIGRFEPSSRLCSCGYYNHELTLKDREWNCPSCKTLHDRDILAANNIKRFAFCKQNTSKQFLGQELPEFTLGESEVTRTLNQEILLK